jgi:2-dehydropantoate 2-reductase
MRIVIFGAGAVGSVIGARLHQGGADVVLVGRPAHVEAVRAKGLLLRTGEETERVDVPAVASLDVVIPTTNDVVIITAKTQDTPPIHGAIAAWNRRAAVVCGTNGVEHERMALRRFERVYGMVIMAPCTFERPGEVTALTLPTNALIDVGRYPTGVDDTALELAAIVERSPHLMAEADPAVMVKKHTKLIQNLSNISEAVVGIGGRYQPVTKAAMAEAKAVFTAAGLPITLPAGPELDRYTDRVATLQHCPPEGDEFLGGSTWQSISKGATTHEADYFNGEIILLGRLLAIPTPHNQFLQELADELLLAGIGPGSMTADELNARWMAETGGI